MRQTITQESTVTSIPSDWNGQLGTVEGKLRFVAEGLGVNYVFNDWTKANVDFDTVDVPCIMVLQPPSGKLRLHHGKCYNYPDAGIAFLDSTEHDADAVEDDNVVERMIRLAARFIDALNASGMFEQVEDTVIPYQVPYDVMDSMRTGVLLQFMPKELQGIKMCDASFER